MKHKIFSFIILFLIASFIAVSTDYPYAGDTTQDFITDTGFWNSQITTDDYQTFTRSINQPLQMPLVADLDNDGTNEIIVLDDFRVRLFTGIGLTLVDSYSLLDCTDYSGMIAYDIDGDDYEEIIISSECNAVGGQIYILEYNGTAFYNQTELNTVALTHTDGQKMIRCKAEEECAMVYTRRYFYDGATQQQISIVGFNSTTLGTQSTIELAAPIDETFCLPKSKMFDASDIDNDGDIEYTLSYITISGAQEIANIYTYFINSSLGVNLEMQKLDTTPGNSYTEGSNNCRLGGATSLITPPLVAELDPGGFNEIVIAYNIDEDEYQMTLYEGDGTELDTFPDFFDTPGRIISNVMLMNVFEDTGTVDFCTLGYDAPDSPLVDGAVEGDIIVLCGSDQTGEFPETRTYRTRKSDTINYSTDYLNWSGIAHATQQSTELYDGSNFHEVSTSVGIISLTDVDSACEISGICDGTMIFYNPYHESVLLPVDYEEVGRADLIALTQTNLWYIDDGYSKSGGNISNYYVNPCLDSTWKINTSVEARITASDPDGDLVQAKAFLYYGDDNEQDSGWTANSTSGTTFSFPFIANKTIPVGTLRLVARDNDQPNDNTTLDLTFSVGLNGVEFGDCTTDVDIDLDIDVDEAVAVEISGDLNNNSVTNTFRTLEELTGLGGTLSWLLVMAISLGYLWVSTNHSTRSGSTAAMGVIIMVGGIMTIMGTILGFLSFGIMLVVVIFGIVGIALWLRKQLTGIRTD